jgi:A/G-specific adenine glycosylase
VTTRLAIRDRAPLAVVISWYADHARELPWRQADVTPWGVLVSEFMLQQTPVDRVRPVYATWMDRWPTPHALAADSPGEAVRAWGRLGYPRRALRLHACATTCATEFGGSVPSDLDALLALPGVGSYTAAAVAAFAFQQRCAVLDTNVRRVHARLLDGQAFPRSASATIPERVRALDLLPVNGEQAALASVAVMELGALVCTARTPHCDRCPVRTDCAWHEAGLPAWQGPARKGQSYAGTDRQCRGALLAVLREREGPVPLNDLAKAWPTDTNQRMRALDGLVADGLVEPLDEDHYALPS